LDQLKGTTGQQSETIEALQQTIDKLRHELELFKRYVFGQRRERYVEDSRQQKLFEIGPQQADQACSPDEEGESEASSPKRRRGHGRRPLPDFLPRRVEIHELTEQQRLCPCCSKIRIKVSEEISEQLEFQPASLYVIRHVRHIYACQEDGCEANMVTAPKPPQPIDKGLAGPGLLAFVARSTQCDWMAACAMLVRPLYKLIIMLVLQSKVLGTDDTTVPVRDDRLDHTRKAYFWAYVGDRDHPYVAYDFTTSHARNGPKRFLRGFRGYLQGDAFGGYIELARDSNGLIKHAGCSLAATKGARRLLCCTPWWRAANGYGSIRSPTCVTC
jgi:transposase